MKLVVVLTFAIWGVLAAARVSAEATFFYHDALAPGSLLDVRDINGGIAVTLGERLEVRARKTAHQGNPDDVRIETRKTASGLMVCVRYAGEDNDCLAGEAQRRSIANDTRVDFTITVPSGVNVATRTVAGSIDVRSDARVTASAVNGQVAVDAQDADRITTVNGPIAVHLHAAASRTPLTLQTINGSIMCTLPRSAGLRVHARALAGSVDIAGIDVKHSPYGPGATADGVIGDGARKLDLQTLAGTITLIRS